MALLDRIRKCAVDPNLATDMAAYGPFPFFKPTTETRLAKAEARLSISFPTLLRELLTQVGNGGFGPGYGIIGIGKLGSHDDMDQDLVAVNKMHRRGPKNCSNWHWPDSRLTFCYGGCACYYCVECHESLNPVYLFDPSRIRDECDDPASAALKREAKSLELFLENWLRRTRKRTPPTT